VPAGELRAAAQAYAAKLLEKGPLALARALEAVLAGSEVALPEALALGASLFGLCFATEDMREGARAFLGKRKPKFARREAPEAPPPAPDRPGRAPGRPARRDRRRRAASADPRRRDGARDDRDRGLRRGVPVQRHRRGAPSPARQRARRAHGRPGGLLRRGR